MLEVANYAGLKTHPLDVSVDSELTSSLYDELLVMAWNECISTYQSTNHDKTGT
jgi:hypothetical protein